MAATKPAVLGGQRKSGTDLGVPGRGISSKGGGSEAFPLVFRKKEGKPAQES